MTITENRKQDGGNIMVLMELQATITLPGRLGGNGMGTTTPTVTKGAIGALLETGTGAGNFEIPHRYHHTFQQVANEQSYISIDTPGVWFVSMIQLVDSATQCSSGLRRKTSRVTLWSTNVTFRLSSKEQEGSA